MSDNRPTNGLPEKDTAKYFRMNLAQDIMENPRGKGLSFARRIYLPRVIGLGIGFFSVAAALYPLNMPAWIWALLLFKPILLGIGGSLLADLVITRGRGGFNRAGCLSSLLGALALQSSSLMPLHSLAGFHSA